MKFTNKLLSIIKLHDPRSKIVKRLLENGQIDFEEAIVLLTVKININISDWANISMKE